jgi:hypothetical protein
VFWSPEFAAPTLRAVIEPAKSPGQANFVLSRFAADISILFDVTGGQHQIVFKSRRQSLVLAVTGTASFDAPARITFLTQGSDGAARAPRAFAAFNACLSPQRKTKYPRLRATTLVRRRNALIALDGDAAGANYREISTVMFGAKDTAESWSSLNNPRKDQVRRALQRGEALVAGGYRKLLK